MALLNNYYIFVEKEQVKRSVEVSEHPVEKGLPITDNVKRNAIELSVNGYLVDTGTYKNATKKVKGRTAKIKQWQKKKKAKDIAKKIKSWMNNGKYVKYKGKSTLKNALIIDFQEERTNKGWAFTMDIKEVRIASKAYKKSKKKKTTTTKQITKKKKTDKRYYKVKKGNSLWSIAKKYYGDGSKLTVIYKANKSIIDKANKGKHVNKYTIYAKQKLIIP